MNLCEGMRGPNVVAWQERLKVKPDGVFGPATTRATIALALTISAVATVRIDGVVDDHLWSMAGLSELSARVPCPLKMNVGLQPARQSTMLKLLGVPASTMTAHCSPGLSPGLAQRVVTADVGPFNVTGIKEAVLSLRAIFASMADAPYTAQLLDSLSSAGMLCCRAVRGSTTNWSNHSWGSAIDLKIDGQLDAMGDGYAQAGLLMCSKFFNAQGWYWGAGFSREDAMHFEPSEELIRKWYG